MGHLTLHLDTNEDLNRTLQSYRKYARSIRSLNARYACLTCGKITTKEMLQLQRRPDLLCRDCYMMKYHGVRNVSQLDRVKKKKAETRQRHGLSQCKEVSPDCHTPGAQGRSVHNSEVSNSRTDTGGDRSKVTSGALPLELPPSLQET